MKKLLSLYALLLIVCFGVKAQFISGVAEMIKNSTPQYTPGIITFKDGREVEYNWVELPKSGCISLKVSNEEKHKNPEEIAASGILCVTYWTSEFPEKKLTLYKLHADKSSIPFAGALPQEVWGYPIASSEWGTVYKCNYRYELSRKKDEILFAYRVTTQRMGNTVTTREVAASCYLVCRDFENAQLIGGSSSAGTSMEWAAIKMKHITPFFASNPAIAQRIDDGKLFGRDIQYILDEMAIFHGMKDQQDSTQPAEEQISETVSNGTIGDDE